MVCHGIHCHTTCKIINCREEAVKSCKEAQGEKDYIMGESNTKAGGMRWQKPFGICENIYYI